MYRLGYILLTFDVVFESLRKKKKGKENINRSNEREKIFYIWSELCPKQIVNILCIFLTTRSSFGIEPHDFCFDGSYQDTPKMPLVS